MTILEKTFGVAFLKALKLDLKKWKKRKKALFVDLWKRQGKAELYIYVYIFHK